MLVLTLAALYGTTAGCAWKRQAQQKREDAYQLALRSYSETLKPGMTRKEVEDYLHAKNISFGQLCCIDERGAYADLFKTGKESHPWYCEQHNVYIAFQFAAVKPRDALKADDSDMLKRVTIFHKLDGCL